MFLSSVVIENYRAIKTMSLSCESGMTVLIGENSCGKSSLLNALEACLGHRLRGEKFGIAPADFYRNLQDDTQAREMVIRLTFTGTKEDWQNCTEPGVDDEGSNCVATEESKRFDGGMGKQSDGGQRECTERSEDDMRRKRCCLKYLNNEKFRIANDGLSITLEVRSKRQDGDVLVNDYRFLNKQGAEVLRESRRDILEELRRCCPFMRIRSSVLQPPSWKRSGDDARSQVEQVLVQAYKDLLRENDYDAERSLREHSEELSHFYSNLDSLLKSSQPHDLKERVSAPLSPLNSWMHYVSLLRGSGARSLAMLYFAGAFFNAKGHDSLGSSAWPILSVEYPEANLHPLMLTSLWNLIDRLPTQLLITTYCVELLSAIEFRCLRRIMRDPDGVMHIFRVPVERVNVDDMRRIAYHLRVRRGAAMFMRVWLLVEGETEYWLLPEIARAMGFDLWQEGVEFIEFAQCGLEPLVRLANHLGISWFLLCDGDKAGDSYAQKAEKIAKHSNGLGHVMQLSSVDIEHSFWDNGYADVFLEAAGIDKEVIAQSPQHQQAIANNKKQSAKVRAKALEKSRDIIKRAVKKASKPGLALRLGREVVSSGLGIPSDIESLMYNVVRVAREAGGSRLVEELQPIAKESENLDLAVIAGSNMASEPVFDLNITETTQEENSTTAGE